MIGYKRKSDCNKNNDAGTSNRNIRNKEQEGRTSRKRKYDSSYLSLKFTNVINDEVEKLICLLYSKVLTAGSVRPGKLKRHLETTHSEYVGKPEKLF